jgi:conjugal transfer pilus assembly protein TraE
MLHKNKVNILALSKALNGLLLLCTIGLLFAVVILGGALATQLNSKSRTLVPPVISQAFTISDGAVDSSYLQQMGEYTTYLKLNVTPKNVERQYGQLLDYVGSEAWSDIQPTLMADAQQITKENVSSRFDVDEVKVSLDTLQVKLTGTLQKHVGSRALEPELTSYIVDFAYEYGVISLLSIRKIKDKEST